MNGNRVVAGRATRGMVTALKVLGLVAITWGLVFPALFYGFRQLIH
ncbi:hypothetical protein [Pelomonas sp. KK5]|nr:hypothetical protein [Pelomonas sp. KK5]